MIQLLAVLLFSVPGFAAPDTFPPFILAPIDQASQERSFENFRAKLLEALEKKDLGMLEASLGKNIAFSFGGHGDGDGPSGFKRHWNLKKKPEKSKVWGELAKVLRQGGIFSKDHNSFEAPYVWAAWPKSYDYYDFSALNAKDVPLRAEGKDAGAVLKTSSFEILRVKSHGNRKGETWASVELPDGQKAYVQNKFLQSPIGYRARFEWIGKEWKLVTFILSN